MKVLVGVTLCAAVVFMTTGVKAQKEFGFDIAIHHPDNYSHGHANSLRYEFHNVPHYHVHNHAVHASPPPTKSNSGVIVHHRPHLDRFRHVHHGVVGSHHHQHHQHNHHHGNVVHHADRIVHPAPVVHHVSPAAAPAPHVHLAHHHHHQHPAVPCPHPEHQLIHRLPPLLHSHRLVRPFSRPLPFRFRYPSGRVPPARPLRLVRPRPLPPPKIIHTLPPATISEPIEVIHEFVPPLAPPPHVIHAPPTIIETIQLPPAEPIVTEHILQLPPTTTHIHTEFPHSHVHTAPIVQHAHHVPHSHVHAAPIVGHAHHVPHSHVHAAQIVGHAHHVPHHVHQVKVLDQHVHHAPLVHTHHVHQPQAVSHHLHHQPVSHHVHHPPAVTHHVHQVTQPAHPPVTHHVHQVYQQIPAQQPAPTPEQPQMSPQMPQLEPQIESPDSYNREVQFIQPQNTEQQEQPQPSPQPPSNSPPMIPQPY